MKLNDVPLGFLPAFEAAGRLGSFAAAAAELHVTPSAISQQIRTLEDVLDVALFERTGRSVVLTRAGRSYLEAVRPALRDLAASTARVRRRADGSVMRLTTMSLAAHEFLLPRLPDFRQRFPSIELRIETTNEMVDFNVSDCDAAIRIGSRWPDLTARPFGQVTFALVCSPALAGRIQSVKDLTQHTLLDPCGHGQRMAVMLFGRGAVPSFSDVWTFETCHETLSAAAHGLGVTIASFPVATLWVQSGRLAIPLAHRAPLDGSLCLAYRTCDHARFPFDDIGDWLAAEYAALSPLPDGRILPHSTAAQTQP